MGKNKDQSCESCYYFYQTSERGDQKIGYCRCESPKAHFEAHPTSGVLTPKIGKFPIVLNTMWCGQYDWNDGQLAKAAGAAK
jgi:hypothetical protein